MIITRLWHNIQARNDETSRTWEDWFEFNKQLESKPHIDRPPQSTQGSQLLLVVSPLTRWHLTGIQHHQRIQVVDTGAPPQSQLHHHMRWHCNPTQKGPKLPQCPEQHHWFWTPIHVEFVCTLQFTPPLELTSSPPRRGTAVLIALAIWGDQITQMIQVQPGNMVCAFVRSSPLPETYNASTQTAPSQTLLTISKSSSVVFLIFYMPRCMRNLSCFGSRQPWVSMSSWRHSHQEPETTILHFVMLCGMGIHCTPTLLLPPFLP